LIDAGKLIGTVTGDLHNATAMEVLAELGDAATNKALAGSKGGLVRAKREKLARNIATRNQSPDLFATGESQLKPVSNPVETDFKPISNPVENQYTAQNPSLFNGTGQAPLKHTRARQNLELRVKKEEPPCVPPSENGSEMSDDDLFAVPTNRRKPNTALPPGWQPPTMDELSPLVLTRVDQWPDGTFDREREKFMADAVSEDRRHRDWDMAFGKWCLVHDGYLQNRKGKNYGKASGFTVPNLGGS
jgi:hypothetical protein